MDNFEQQFTENVEQTATKYGGFHQNFSRISLIIISIMGIFLIIETVALVATIINQFNDSAAEQYDEDVEYTPDDEKNVYDDDGNLTATMVACSSSHGEHYSFTAKNQYKQYDSSSTTISSGKYTIIQDKVISLNPSEGETRTLYYDGYILVDGTTIYDCE